MAEQITPMTQFNGKLCYPWNWSQILQAGDLSGVGWRGFRGTTSVGVRAAEWGREPNQGAVASEALVAHQELWSRGGLLDQARGAAFVSLD